MRSVELQRARDKARDHVGFDVGFAVWPALGAATSHGGGCFGKDRLLDGGRQCLKRRQVGQKSDSLIRERGVSELTAERAAARVADVNRSALPGHLIGSETGVATGARSDLHKNLVARVGILKLVRPRDQRQIQRSLGDQPAQAGVGLALLPVSAVEVEVPVESVGRKFAHGAAAGVQ